jgi:hypothetical protein
VSDLADAAGAALGIPATLVERSASARASASGTTTDDVLVAWSGGASVPAAATEAVATSVEAPEPATTAPVTAPALTEAPVVEVPVFAEVDYEPDPVDPLEPVSLGTRLGTAVKVGAWTGAGLGLIAFFVSSSFWAPDTAVLPDGGPVVQISSDGLMIGAALISVLFGAIVAGFSRAAASWMNPAMQLTSSKPSTAWIGAGVGLLLGAAGGALLASLGTPVESSEESLIQLPVLATLGMMLVGGAVLGALTAAIPQLLGTPVAVDATDSQEVATVKERLGNAMSIPMAGLLILILLVLPFGYLLIQSNHVASGGAALVAVIVAVGILGFASLAGNRPEVRITTSDLVVAFAGIATVILVVLAVMFMNSDTEHEENGEGDAHAVVHLI